ncbi:hypothetical protein [Actinoplanes sp. NPDC049802]|uniref:hypothetical protein n=1 Tax=Actinoplanes sp. NPDC049802 TaxID=3154742 RepID=UPI0033F8D65A
MLDNHALSGDHAASAGQRRTAEPVRPGQPARDYTVAPYPGERPAGSWVIDQAKRCWPVVPDEGMPSGWAVLTGQAAPQCLDGWLTRQGAAPLAERVPVVSYGSNACPGKILDNKTTLPSVNLACTMRGLASVWCNGTRRSDGVVPVTLAAASSPEYTETAVVAMADQSELARLDVVEGRFEKNSVYELQVLHTGSIELENGARVPRPAAYVGARKTRWPLLVNGEQLLRVDADQDTAARLHAKAPASSPPVQIGIKVPFGTPLSPGECTPALSSTERSCPARPAGV